MKTYTFTFTGDVTVKAKSKEEAQELAEDLTAPMAWQCDNSEDYSVYEVELKEVN